MPHYPHSPNHLLMWVSNSVALAPRLGLDNTELNLANTKNHVVVASGVFRELSEEKLDDRRI